MKKSSKIINTMLCVLFFEIVLFISGRFLDALICMDDEGIFLYGFVLMAMTCFIVLFAFTFATINSIWGKDKRGKKK
jgi:hypothetical protein